MFSSVYNSVYKLNALQKQSCYVYLATTVNLSMLIPQINNNNNKKHSAFEMLYEKIAQEYRLALHEWAKMTILFNYITLTKNQ